MQLEEQCSKPFDFLPNIFNSKPYAYLGMNLREGVPALFAGSDDASGKMIQTKEGFVVEEGDSLHKLLEVVVSKTVCTAS